MYTTISDFGHLNDANVNDPATYCVLDGLDSQFLHGSLGFAKGNFNCSEYMSSRCAQVWDNLCEAYSETDTVKYPRPTCSPKGLTDGQAFLREAAFKRYLLSTKNCFSICAPFDPTVANSPMICYFTDTAPTTGPSSGELWLFDGNPVSGGCSSDYPPCQKVYGFTDEQMKNLDFDAIMNNILRQPNVAIDLITMLAQWVIETKNVSKVINTNFWRFATNNNLYSS